MPSETTTSTAPTVWAGVVAVIDVALMTAKLDAAVVPNFTLVTLERSAPVMVTAVPPLLLPLLGEMDAMAGG